MHVCKETVEDQCNNFPFTRQLGVEDLWVSVQSHMYPTIIIGCVYRHPKEPVVSFEYVHNVLRQLRFS